MTGLVKFPTPLFGILVHHVLASALIGSRPFYSPLTSEDTEYWHWLLPAED